LGGTTVVSLTSAFFYGTRSRRREREEKNKVMVRQLAEMGERPPSDEGPSDSHGGESDEEAA
jgi:hypothetical protein